MPLHPTPPARREHLARAERGDPRRSRADRGRDRRRRAPRTDLAGRAYSHRSRPPSRPTSSAAFSPPTRAASSSARSAPRRCRLWTRSTRPTSCRPAARWPSAARPGSGRRLPGVARLLRGPGVRPGAATAGRAFVWAPSALVAHFRPAHNLRQFFAQYYRYARGDGKADLWRRRHAIRYGTYLAAPRCWR